LKQLINCSFVSWHLPGFVPELDENGKPLKSDGKFAVTASAFVVAGGAIALRIGGRAALVSGLGLDFITNNPELQGQMNQILEFSDSMDPIAKAGLFTLAWTLVKVLCVDAGGVVLALSSGILFGGVLEGAVMSAFSATVGSSAAFGLAKLDTPVRKKALEILEEQPALRGIERVVAQDGLKAILTLRLAPILPVPLGFYNYIYGVSNVPYFDFAGGIFLGSLKPYLLDSYLGYFGKTVVDGSASADGGIQDYVLLGALGVSVLVGSFASQLAGETWDTVLEEIEVEEKAKAGYVEEEIDDGIVRDVFGQTLPQWMVGFQLALKEADIGVNDLIDEEFDAKLWNYTKSEGENPIPRELDPAFKPGSPEIVGAFKGLDIPALSCDGLVLSPSMFSAWLRYSDPLFDQEEYTKERELWKIARSRTIKIKKDDVDDGALKIDESTELSKESLLSRLGKLRTGAEEKLNQLEQRAEFIDRR
jgi:uncharacterized membrane protein YdjX (TVP38/TMEM64 family)